MVVRSEFRGSPLQNFFLSCPRTRFYCAGGMLRPPQKRMPDLQMSRVVLGLALKAGGAGGLKVDSSRGEEAERRRRSLRRTHAGVVLGGFPENHFETTKHRETSVNLPVSVVSCVVSFALIPQRNPCKH
jgi:hypothetical protein